MTNYYYEKVSSTISQDLAELKSLRLRLLEEEQYEYIAKIDQLILDGKELIADKNKNRVFSEKDFQVFKTKKILITNLLKK